MSGISREERGKKVALGVGCGDDADGIWNNKGRKPFLDGGDFGESNNQLFRYRKGLLSG